ncbi:Inner membrane amino-acid ABC transporter permease protein YhdY [bacterium HR40]|nr:Inner membrane amino-acid ABC transporter permease protein YhdY [bacterium HR40]
MAAPSRPTATAVVPPVTARIGLVAWLRTNLFSTWYNSLLTVLVAWLLWITLVPFFDWALLRASFAGDSKEACTAGGACWTMVRVRFGQYLYGLYPESERWRVNLAFGLLAFLSVPLFLAGFRHRLLYLAILIALYPPVAWVLFRGGILGLPSVETALWGGLFLTLVIAGVGITASFPLGILLALGRRSELPVIRALSVVFIEVVRGVPLVTVLFMASVMLPLFLPVGVTIDKLLRALVGVALFSAAYMAEVVRGGLQAVPKGQYEAAMALGLGYWQTMGLVVLPQALRLVIPGIVNTFIGLFKDTSLVTIIGLYDLLGIAKLIVTDPQWLGLAAESYLFAGFGFWLFCFGMSRYSQRVERRLDSGRTRR